jgi:hypothetical protein
LPADAAKNATFAARTGDAVTEYGNLCPQKKRIEGWQAASTARRNRARRALRERRPRHGGGRESPSGETAVTDEIGAIVDQAIMHTRRLLESSTVEWEVARVGLMKIRDTLADDAPGDPALDRLRDFIAEQDRLRRNQ